MGKYVVFVMPDNAWDGIDWLYDLNFARKNQLKFALVNAKKPEEAKKKYFYEFYMPSFMDSEDLVASASLCSYLLHQDYEKNEIINLFGEADADILWDITQSYAEQEFSDDYHAKLSGYGIKDEYYDNRIESVSTKTLELLSFMEYEYRFAVSAFDMEIK